MESSLALKLSDLSGEIGLFLGYGRGADNGDTTWTSNQQAAIDSCVNSGLRQFYFPPPIEGTDSSYDWSFLRPIREVTLSEGEQAIALPGDFGGLDGSITIQATSTSMNWPITVVGEGSIRKSYSESPDTTGRPTAAAVRPLKGTTPRHGQRFELAVWPAADADYTLQLCYYVHPDCLSAANPYPLGGVAHAETLLESCLSIAEQRLDDAATVHTLKFQERLLASISMDRRMKPQKIGYNADRSDGFGWRRDRSWSRWAQVSYEGDVPE